MKTLIFNVLSKNHKDKILRNVYHSIKFTEVLTMDCQSI